MHRDGDGHDATEAPQYSPYSYADDDDDDKEGGRNAHQWREQWKR